MRGRKTTDESKQIIRLVKKGLCFSDIKKKGFKKQTIVYYIRKIRKPELHIKFTDYIKSKNKIKYWNTKKAL